MQKQQNDEAAVRQLLSEFLTLFYHNGWVTGTGGGICAAFDPTPTDTGKPVLMAPTRVHKERVKPEDLFVINSEDGSVLRGPHNQSLCLSECAPIFCWIINNRGAGSVVHTHALPTVLAADISQDPDRFIIESLEMLKGISGENNKSRHQVPIINNVMYEKELMQQLRETLVKPEFSRSYCLLVRDHGAYIWGADIWEAKRHAEVYHFLFEAMVERRKMRLLK
jgi:methylthioribulose-1-phosphate dehydratase